MSDKMSDKMKEVYDQLKKDFPREAHDIVGTGFKLTAIKAQFIVERLNDVFGLGKWCLTGNFEQANNNSGVLYHGKLSATVDDITIEVDSVGFSEIVTKAGRHKNIGDAYKSARTDCLSKAASWLGVGNKVFKGQVDERYLEQMKLNENKNQAKQGIDNSLNGWLTRIYSKLTNNGSDLQMIDNISNDLKVHDFSEVLSYKDSDKKDVMQYLKKMLGDMSKQKKVS